MKGLATALRFLTILPVPGRAEVPEEVLGRSTAWFPLVGALLGAILAGASWLAARLWSPLAVNVLTVVLWVLLTRGLHLDGLADTADGLGGGSTRERKLAIMKDSRIGTFGVLAVLCLLGLKLAFLAETGRLAPWRPLIAAAALARWGMLMSILAFPAAVQTGMAARFKRACRWPQALVGTVTALAASWLCLGFWGFAVLGFVAAVSALWSWRATRILGGHTGDTYGALCEACEAGALMAISLLVRFARI